MRINPVIRGLATGIAIIGALLCSSPVLLMFAWFGVLIAVAVTGVLRTHIRSIGLLGLTIGLPLFILWVIVLEAPPGQPSGSPETARSYVYVLMLRLMVVAGVTQACFLPLMESDRLAPTLRGWGMKRGALSIAVSSVFLAPDLGRCAEQVLTARVARGFLGKRSYFSLVLQLPFLLQPLLVRSLRSALQRAEVWEKRGLLNHLTNESVSAKGWSMADLVTILAAGAWLTVATLERAL